MASAPQRAAADTAPGAGLPATVSTDPLPTAQINGVVWSQTVVNDIVYAGGPFTRARPAGAAGGHPGGRPQQPRGLQLTTGVTDLVRPDFNGIVRGRDCVAGQFPLYVVGQFTKVNGVTRNRIAAFTLATGPSHHFAPQVNCTVYGMRRRDHGVRRRRLHSDQRRRSEGGGAITASNAAPAAFNRPPRPAARSTGHRVAGRLEGRRRRQLHQLNGSSNPGYGLAMLDRHHRSHLPSPVNSLIRNAGTNSGDLSLAGNADGFYGAGYVFGAGGNLEGAFKANWNGDLQWVEDCHGDTYSVFPSGEGSTWPATRTTAATSAASRRPTRGHWTYQRGLAFTDDARGTVSRDPLRLLQLRGPPASRAAALVPGFQRRHLHRPDTGSVERQRQRDYMVYGGEFTRVNNVPQQGLVRFARTNLAPNDDGPRLGTGVVRPHCDQFRPGRPDQLGVQLRPRQRAAQLRRDQERQRREPDLQHHIAVCLVATALPGLPGPERHGRSELQLPDPSHRSQGQQRVGNPITITATRAEPRSAVRPGRAGRRAAVLLGLQRGEGHAGSH